MNETLVAIIIGLFFFVSSETVPAVQRPQHSRAEGNRHLVENREFTLNLRPSDFR
jgi:hypothetical protein